MGRLFWKFFLSILLAQVAATIGIGGTLWLRNQARHRATEPTLDAGQPAVIMLDAAAVTLKHGGIDGLRDLAATTRRVRLFVLDEQDHELLGRAVPPRLREEVARNLETGARNHAVARLTAPDGRHYLAFASRMPGPRQGQRSGGGGATPDAAASGAPLADAAARSASLPAESVRQASADGPPTPARAGAGGSNAAPGPGAPPEAAGPGPGPGRAPGTGPGRRLPRWFGLPPEVGRQVGHWVPIVAATVASLLFAALLAWYFSRPIRALRGAFEAAAGGDLAPRFGKARMAIAGDELAELGHDFDRMSAQLRTLMDGQRRLLHDVSHELRSPLARLQAAIGLAHQQPDKIQASLERIERESVRMDRLVGELLTLSRLEAAGAPPPMEPLDLVEMVDQIADDARFEAGVRIDVEAPVPVSVCGAPDLLWSAVENIVRNAVKHGGPAGTVGIAVHPEGALVHVEVLDRGPGIPDDDLGEIFEPFFRSRPAQNNVDGHGLGLAIAKRVVETHGGRIVAANREGGGLRVTITLPRLA